MSFVQILSFHTDDLDAFAALERRWTEESEGRRTVLDGALYRDRTDPQHYVSLTWFASWEDAQVNSALPETDALARAAAALATGPVTFTDLDLVTSADVRVDAATGLRRLLETNDLPQGLLTDDVEAQMYVPNWAVAMRGVEPMMAGLRDEAPSRTIERWDVHPSGEGFLVEYAYRNHATAEQPTTLSIGTLAATLRGGRIASLRIHCAGNWTAELEAQVAEAGGPVTGSTTAPVPA